MPENYEGTAIDSSVFEENIEQPVEVTQTEPVETAEPEENPAGDTGNSVVDNTFDIPGVGKVTAEEVLEWRNGGLRQADYTRKTQELAQQKTQNAQALELYEYLQQNPHLVNAMREAEINPNPDLHVPTLENKVLQEVLYKQKALETDMKLSALKDKYGNVDEIAVLNKAAELGTDDLEFVYQALSYNANSIDKEAWINEAKEQLKAELLANQGAVQTTVATNQHTPVETTSSLTDEEKRIASALGMTEAEYSKWK